MQKKTPDSKAVSALLARLREASGCPGTLGLTTLLNLPSSSLLRTHRRALSGLEARNISPSQRLVLQLRALLSRLEPGVRTKRIGGVPERTLLRRHRDFIIAKREQGFPVALLKRAVFAAWRSQVRLRV